MDATQNPTFQLIGETVTVNYVADPSVGYGRFRLENREAVVATAAVESVWLELGERRHLLTDITVFDLDQEQTVNPAGFEVGAGATLVFLVGFPRIAYEPPFGESVAVGLRLCVNGTELGAKSSIQLVRRIRHRDR